MTKAHLKTHYLNIWQDLKEARTFIFAVIGLFLLGNILAWLNPQLSENIVALFIEYFKTFQDKTLLQLTLAIFVNNATVAFLAILLGLFFGLLPVFAAIVNGIGVGAVLAMSPVNFFKILPHAIFELPAIFIAWGLGLWCAGWLVHAPRWETVKVRLKRSLNIYVSLILPMLVVAAVLEVVGGMLFFC
jgi:stage II sporulation protein M